MPTSDTLHITRHPSPQSSIMITIYHNTHCSKSRAACELVERTLNVRGEALCVVEYLKQPLTVAELKELHRMLRGPVRSMLRDTEPVYKELGLGHASVTDEALFEAMAAHPILLQRPIVTRDGRAVIGRPTEVVRTLFE